MLTSPEPVIKLILGIIISNKHITINDIPFLKSFVSQIVAKKIVVSLANKPTIQTIINVGKDSIIYA